MFQPVVFFIIFTYAYVTAFTLVGRNQPLHRPLTVMSSASSAWRNAVVAAVVGATSLSNIQSVRAEIDYEGVKYLGGGDKVDLNNANIRAYLKIPGLYPTIASKLVNNGPYKTVQDVFNIPSLSSSEKETLKKAESRFVVLEGKPEYVIDKINNGLYK